MGVASRDIILTGETLAEGQSIRILCPFCGGGKSAEETLSITRDADGVVWHCFRAHCGVTGAANTTSVAPTARPKQSVVWEGKTYPLPETVVEILRSRWHFTEVPPDWYWTTDYGGRLAMSVRSPSDTHRGWVLRDLTGKARTKVLTYIEPEQEGLSWYKTQPNAPTLIVEDIPSAMRAADYVNTVALLGTGIGLARAMEIANYAPRPIVMALDQDASEISIKWARKYALLWGDVKVLLLDKDLKDLPEPDLEGRICTL